MLRILIISLLTICSLPALHAQRDCHSEETGTRFTWGASLNGGVELGGNDMSTIGIDGFFGARFSRIQSLGIGASLNVPVNNSNRMIPVYAMIQTNFSSRSTLCFLDVRCGLSINYIQDEESRTEAHQTGFYGSAGLGFNLAGNSSFQSYMTVGYSYFGRENIKLSNQQLQLDDLHVITMRLGIRF